ncbi:pyridoxine/pyridoxamine 5'-phosphate oxidase [Elysia marginata]|uniref:pyridoxal 5'-phosphate synthase n=1 Tax=Elysia marginata TaxID=1093978 RepID=A0AAV4FQS5_9GAST|nr:pyridoxine/pyridoxamine 5'-phosphate oxidase [Elysia marginata]
MELFQKWYFEAEENEIDIEVNAMTLSSISLDGYPKNRVVLLKRFTYEGFEFYTNYNSEKGKAISKNPKVCLSFFWEKSERQVIIKGTAKKVPDNISDGYFETRPRQSCLVALASEQSDVIPSKEFLTDRVKQAEGDYQNKRIKRPEHWGGFLVTPISVEFWQGGANRLHDRIRYTIQKDFSWLKERLAP